MLVLGIAGGTGSGKTTVVNRLVEALSENGVVVISQDAYYNDLSHLTKEERGKVNFDHPDSIDFGLLAQHLGDLKKGKAVQAPTYSFVEETRLPETVRIEPQKTIIVEGILVLADPKLRALFDVKLYVDADPDERFIRRLQRDIKERGHDLEKVLYRYRTAVKPMHDRFVAPSKEHADVVLTNNHGDTAAADRVLSIINKKLGQCQTG